MKLKNRIFHIMTISLLILSAVLLSACGKQETAGSMKLTKAELSHKEKALADLYEYAYWLGYIYRCECHMHDESSRMVYGAFNEKFMRDFYQQLSLDDDTALIDCAPEICRRLDVLLVGKLWR